MKLSPCKRSDGSSGSLVGSQRFHGIYGSGAAGGEDGSDTCEHKDGEGCQHKDEWVQRIDLEEERAEETRGEDRDGRSDGAAGQSKFCAGEQNQPQDAEPL